MTEKFTACGMVRDLLALRVSEDLTVDEAAQVDQHTRYCDSCRKLLNGFSTTVGVLREAAEQPVQTDDRPSLWNRIEPRLGPAGRQQRMPLAWATTRQLAVACSALLALTILLEAFTTQSNAPTKGFTTKTTLRPVGTKNEQFVDHEAVLKPMLGIAVQDVEDALARRLGMSSSHGAIVSHVLPGSAADLAGFETADVILKVNNVTVKSASHLGSLIGRERVGALVDTELLRDGRKIKRSVQLGLRQSKVDNDREILEDAPVRHFDFWQARSPEFTNERETAREPRIALVRVRFEQGA